MTDSGSGRLRVGTARSTSSNPFEAGSTAARAALEPLAGATPSLVLVFATPQYDLAALLEGVRSITRDALLVGGTGSGEIVTGEYLGFGAGVAVMALAGGPYRFAAASQGDISGDLDAVGQALARAAHAAAGPSPYAAAILITDSMLGNLQEFVQGVYRITGPKVALVGGAAGDEAELMESSVFHDRAVLRKGAAVLWVASDRPLHVVTRHGWQPSGPLTLVTRASGTEIAELGGRPAVPAYDEQSGTSYAPEEFWPTAVWRPFGLVQPDGSHVIRVPRAKNPDGTLTIHGCVPPVGSAVQIMCCTVDGLLDVDEQVVDAALRDERAAEAPQVLLIFSCAGRAFMMGDRAPEEARRLQAAAGEIPTFGFYCCAEFARTSGTLATHNATLTAIAL